MPIEEVKPCPFCGAKAWLRDDMFNDTWIECDDCQIGTPHGTFAEAVIAWNARAHTTPTAADTGQVERLTAHIADIEAERDALRDVGIATVERCDRLVARAEAAEQRAEAAAREQMAALASGVPDNMRRVWSSMIEMQRKQCESKLAAQEEQIAALERNRDGWIERSDAAHDASLYAVQRHAEAEAKVAAQEEQIERLTKALAWIDNTDPELVAAAEEKFGFKLFPEGSKR